MRNLLIPGRRQSTNSIACLPPASGILKSFDKRFPLLIIRENQVNL
jgi:hypothetical protein